MIATLKGRLQTKIIALIIPAIAAVPFAYFRDCTAYYTMFALMVVIGLTLETIYSFFIDYEPGWLTILFGAIEFLLIYAVLKLLNLDIILSHNVSELSEGLSYYLTVWGLNQILFIYFLPVWNISWLEHGNELW